MKITRFEDIEAWKSARVMTREIYAETKAAAWNEDRDLKRQIRRASTSSMANIAEGFDGGSDKEFRRFLRISLKSTTEIQSHLYVALDQEFISQKKFDSLYERAKEVKNLLCGFIRYLSRNPRAKA